jgi:predicted adenine nucleotide alpha hydrolase (AANH) superfamily ATPase
MRLLLHICCANCSLYPVRHLTAQGVEIKGFWFNPNIHPRQEYARRLETLRTLEGLWDLDIEYAGHYGLGDFLREIKDHDGIRCARCYLMRLRETAATAKKMALDGFTTTLLVSPYQKFDLIVELGRQAAREYSIPFHAWDFRAGWQEGVGLSRELGLYRQNYCGCVFSGQERLSRRKKRSRPRQAGVAVTV